MFHAKVKCSKYLSSLRAFFPQYKGRTVILVEGETAHISDYWSEGHRAYPRVFDLMTMRGTDMEPWFKRQQQGNTYGANIGEVTLAPGIGLVEHVYSGIRQYLRVTLHPSDDKGDWIV